MARLANAFGWIKREFLEILPVTIFFLIAFLLITYTKHLVLAEKGIAYDGVWVAIFGALLVAKVVLVLDKLRFMQLFRGRPLYLLIFYRAVVYTLGVGAIRLLEMLIRNFAHEGGFAGGIAALGAELARWEEFVFVQIWVLALFLVYETMIQLRKQTGAETLSGLLFSSREDSRAGRS